MTDLITLPRATVQQALKALEGLVESAEPECGEETCGDCSPWRPAWAAIAALKAALKQPEQCMAHGECFGGQCIYTSRSGQPEQDTDCHAQGICQRSGYGIKQPEQEPAAWSDARLRGIASDYFPDAKDWPAAMLCLRHLLMEQAKYPPASAPEQEPVAWGCFKSGELQTELIGTEADVDFWCKSDEVQMQGMVKGPLFTRPPRREPEQTNPWRDAVDHELSTLHMVASDDPRESVRRLIDWHCAVQLDPLISSAAQELIERGRREALEQPEQAEPVATVEIVVPHLESIGIKHILGAHFPQVGDYLYTAPPRREWRSLSEKEIGDVFHAARNAKLGAANDNSRHRLSVVEIARAIDAALKEKNHHD